VSIGKYLLEKFGSVYNSKSNAAVFPIPKGCDNEESDRSIITF
jgi:hypothetical protein